MCPLKKTKKLRKRRIRRNKGISKKRRIERKENFVTHTYTLIQTFLIFI